jgi:Domain of unknown function (DUF4249)
MVMRRPLFKYGLVFFAVLIFDACRKPYNPPAIKASNHFLAIDGFINTGTSASTSFTLTRSRSLTDTVTNIPEYNAQVLIQGSGGSAYPLVDTGHTGVYVSAPLSLDITQNYQLAVTTSDGNKYLSDFVSPKTAPPIDSVTWDLIDDPVTGAQAVRIFVNGHDPANNTHYYRWDFLETYQHVSLLETPWGESNGLIYPFVFPDQIHTCWSTDRSNDILVGSSVALSQDVISHAQIANIPQNDPRMDIEYSILVRQYPLTLDGYDYWLTVQKNSQSLGGLFDLQPSQVTGNIHSITNPGNPVLGYVSASSVQELRMFISNKDLPGWQSNPTFSACTQVTLPTDPLNLLVYNYPDTSYGPYHFAGDFIIFLVVAPKVCLDCRYQGGINVKPSFWP